MKRYSHCKINTNIDTVIVGLYGAGGFAREVMPLIVRQVANIATMNSAENYKVLFVETRPKNSELNGYPIISEQEFFALECKQRFFNVAIADSHVRERIANECVSKGAKPMLIQSEHSIIYDNNEIGEGAIICAYTVITSNAKVGSFFHANIYSYIAHDCIIGDYVTFAPNVHCNGHVHIHDHAYVGTGAIIRQGSSEKPIVIGKGAVVGMGAVVTKDVLPFTTVIGNPAKPHSRS